jgi:hypothetical protein
MNNLHIIPFSPFGPIFPSLLEHVRFAQFITETIRNLVSRIISAVLALFKRPSEPRPDTIQPEAFKESDPVAVLPLAIEPSESLLETPQPKIPRKGRFAALLDPIRKRSKSLPQTTQPEILKESGLLTDIPEGKDNPLSKKIDPSFSKELTDSYIDPQTGDFQKGRLFFELAKDFLRSGIPLINGAPSDEYSQSSSLMKLKIILQKKLKEFGLSDDEIKVVIDEIRNTTNPQNQKPCIDSLLRLIQDLELCTEGDKSLILKVLPHLYQSAFAQMRIASAETRVAWEVDFVNRTETAPGTHQTFSYNLIMNGQVKYIELLSSYLTHDKLRNEQATVHFDARIDLQTGVAEIFNYRSAIEEI